MNNDHLNHTRRYKVKLCSIRALMKQITLFLLLISAMASNATEGNIVNDSFNKSKKILEHTVYNQTPKKTLYCNATFNSKTIVNSNGFVASKYKSRGKKLEWEHIVAVEHFGQAFKEWRVGHELCINSQRKPFKGRQCASKINHEFRYMVADMYNLYPAIGSVNAVRSNKKFTEGSKLTADDTSCLVQITNKKVEPRDEAKGVIARASLYMDSVYKKFNLSSSNRQLFTAWNKLYPVTKAECERAKKIEILQHNSNDFIKAPCVKLEIW